MFFKIVYSNHTINLILPASVPQHGHGHSHFLPSESVQQNGVIIAADSDFSFASADKASITTDPPVEKVQLVTSHK